MFVRTYAGAIVGIDAVAVTVEVNIAGGGLGMYLVGLPDNAVKESEQRIRAAFENSGERMSGRKVVVSLAPADLRKEGASFDLPIAVGILAAMGRVDAGALGGTMFAGELSLDGTLKPVRGVLPMAVRARGEGLRRLVLPADNAREAAVVEGIDVLGAGSLKEVMALLNGEAEIVPAVPGAAEPFEVAAGRYEEDFADVKGQALAKRALEIAAAGGHNVLMIGAPGSGKTMLARRMPTILPPLSPGEALETTKIHSVAGKAGVAGGLMARRPYRAPHHTISQVALIGGGQSPRPGEVSLAHNGVLFLDELPEFGRSVLEVLRQPLEEKKITVSRAKYSVEYPANFTLVAAMNPCPCGYYNHPARECVCSPGSVHRYMSRISGPLMDRIDMHVEVTPVSAAELSAAAPGESSAAIRARVVRAREVQAARFRCAQGVHTNAMMNAAMLREYCRPDAASAALLERAMERLNLSARAYDRILKVARTIADLAGRDTVAAAAGYAVQRATDGRVYASPGEVPANRAGLLLGTSRTVRSGRPNAYFYNRVDAAAALYHAGKVEYLVISGDNGRKGYNEPQDMKEALVGRGVPAEAIYLDYAGFRTYDSVVRMEKIFGQESFTVISQEFHNRRAVYIAQALGLDAVGYNAADVAAYAGMKTRLREKLARVRMFMDLWTGKTPKFLGEPVEIGK